MPGIKRRRAEEIDLEENAIKPSKGRKLVAAIIEEAVIEDEEVGQNGTDATVSGDDGALENDEGEVDGTTGVSSSSDTLVDSSDETPEARNSQLPDTQTAMTDRLSQSLAKKLKSFRRRSLHSQSQGELESISFDESDESPAETGVILRLELHNFMCHEAFSLDFGEQTNFIIGRNGSGKSAILTGLSIAMGAKASDTDRGNSLKGLIMHGKNYARVKLTFKNEGDLAYMPELYGKRISVERVIPLTGSSSFSIRNESGQVISKKKKTLDEILRYYRINIANPMTILTQTEAKTFLARSSDREKYDYFMQGTRLQEAYENVESVRKNVTDTLATLSGIREMRRQRKEKFEKAKKVRLAFRNTKEFEKRLRMLSAKRLWIDVTDEEDKMQRAKELREKWKKEVNRLNDQVADFQGDIALKRKQTEKAKTVLHDEVFAERERSNEQKEKSKEQLNLLQTRFRSLDRNLKNVNQEISDDRESIKRLDDQILREKARLAHSTGEAFDRLRNLKQQQEIKLAETERLRMDASAKIVEIEEEMKDKVSGMEGEIRGLRADYTKLDREKQRLGQSGDRQERMVGQQLNGLIMDVRRHKSDFRGRVIGPIGLNIELKQRYQKWGWVLETIMQRILNTFLVENFSDSQALKQRVKSFRTNNEISVRKPEVFDFSNSVPQNDELKVMDVLSIEDKNIECLLVDANRIHTTLLIESRRTAESVLLQDTRNLISSVICFVPGGALRISKRNGTLQTDPILPQRRRNANWLPLRIVGDSSDPLARLNRDMEDITERLAELNKEKHAAEQRYRGELIEAQREAKRSQQRTREIRAAISKASAKMEDMDGGTAKLDALEEERNKLNDHVIINIQQEEELREDSQRALKKLTVQKEEFEKIVKDNKVLEQREDSIKKTLENLMLEIDEFQDNITTNKKSIEKTNSDISKLDAFLDKEAPEIERLIEQADSRCSRALASLQPGDTKESVENRIQQVKDSLKRIEEEVQISREQADKNFTEAKAALDYVTASYNTSDKLYSDLEKAMETRVENLSSTLGHMIIDVGSAFESAMRIRNFEGKISFDLRNRRLALRVSTKKTEKLRNVESLSGGEKSYAQIAFLLAIWMPMTSTVRGLDEFDVFMDQVNRRLTLKLILQKVRQKPKTQTIFITPLAIGKIPGMDHRSVNIQEITPPERGNSNVH
ncbi:DEKNAAC104126 [Brettanomyces naardenensis]|uniref:DEKNAAC104126 n=1 Tax=Brettanomyces naardenensis TaxID=13370 RepID=A0A448YPW8_BRENA|nr:DEKNAAC104126 [Brettanomyces naardenensis]